MPESNHLIEFLNTSFGIVNRYTMLVQYLIEKGSHLSHKGVGGLDALHVAVRAGNVQIVFLLLSGGSCVDSQDECHESGRRR